MNAREIVKSIRAKLSGSAEEHDFLRMLEQEVDKGVRYVVENEEKRILEDALAIKRNAEETHGWISKLGNVAIADSALRNFVTGFEYRQKYTKPSEDWVLLDTLASFEKYGVTSVMLSQITEELKKREELLDQSHES